MSRHRFRSQPALARSGRRVPPAIIWIFLAAGLALGGGALVSTLYRAFAPEFAQVDEATRLGFTRDIAPAPSDVAALPPPVQVTAPQQPAPAAVVRAKAPAAPQKLRKAKPANEAPPPPTQQQQWETQRVDYERAREVYDANERKEGYRWAQANRIKLQRYCRPAAQRTPAFMEGCMSYLRSSDRGAPEKPRDSSEPRPSDQG